MTDTNGKQLQDIHALQVKMSEQIGTMRGQLSNVVLNTRQMAAEQAAMRTTIQDHGKEIGRLAQLCEDRLKACGYRFEELCDDLGEQRSCLRSLTEGTGKIKIEVVKQQAAAAAKKRVLKYVGTVAGALATGGGLTFLFQFLSKC